VYVCLLKARGTIGSPAEDGEGPCADLALHPVILFYHLDEWVVGCAEAVVAHGWEVRDFRARTVDVGLWARGRHYCFSCSIITRREVLVIVEGRKEEVLLLSSLLLGCWLLLLGALCQAFDKKKKEMTVAALLT